MDRWQLQCKFRGVLLGVAESLVERRGFDGGHMAAVFARNFAAEPWRRYGAGPPQVFALLQQGVPWDQAARQLFEGAGSFGNGAAMRVAPVALMAFPDLEQVAALARQTALITHAHELGIEGAVLQACAIASRLHERPDALEPQAFLEALYGCVQVPVYREKLDMIQTLLPTADRRAVIERLGNGVAADEAVPTALYAFLRHPHAFAEAVTYAISLGGDTDTIASMTGALAGASLGMEAIPRRWRERVEGAARLRALADTLLYLATRSG
jgi:poly(ADP-ribose) glycohydrolase ARH3